MSNRQEKARRRDARLAAEREEARRANRMNMVTWGAAIFAVLAGVALIVVFVVGHRKDDPTVAPAVAAPAAAAAPASSTRSVPRQIAANAKQANQIVDGSIEDKLAELKGVPVVVNQWASWCPNCKQEFPYFQQVARTYGHRVAFVGLDSQDNRSDAEAFLRSFPVTYPSIYDASAGEARSLGAGQGWPTTIYYDRTGRKTYVREGGYTTLASLQADIRRYALGETS
ncbi:MAG: TlpA family protein disulfide reductase [Solirubrobacterales bacterium]